MNRDYSIDIVRGIAIFTMVAANLAGGFLQEPHPTPLRFYGTFAASSFVILAGMMAAFSIDNKQKDFNYLLKRGFFIFLIALADDFFLWNLYPGQCIDVLFLIAFAMPLCYWFSRAAERLQWGIVISIFALTPLMQMWLGYAKFPHNYIFLSTPLSKIRDTSHLMSLLLKTANNWLVSGWFPLFPWLGFAFLGVLLFRLRVKMQNLANNTILYIGLGLFAMGAALWLIFPIQHLVRDGYSELFYPATIAYILLAISVMLLVFYLVDSNNTLQIYAPFLQLGKVSLFMYLFHFTFIKHVIGAYWHVNTNINATKQPFSTYILVYFALVTLMIALAYLINHYKKRWKNKPYLIQLLIGS